MRDGIRSGGEMEYEEVGRGGEKEYEEEEEEGSNVKR